MVTKTNAGNFFEDFEVGQEIVHATPRTVTSGDVALYTALYGPRFAVQSSDQFARSIGYSLAPVDDLLVFHVVFGKTVPDISLNAVANLGYADCRFGVPVFPDDTLSTRSTIIGVKENSNGKTGVVYVRSKGVNQRHLTVLEFVRWVMVGKGDANAPTPKATVPDLPEKVMLTRLALPAEIKLNLYDDRLAGSPYRFGNYKVGEKIDHVDGMTVEEAEHALATRLYQNTAKVHFNLHTEREGRFGRRIVYGGHVISLARSLSFNGLGNAFRIAAINAGSHVAPCFAGDTVYAWTEILEKEEISGLESLGALRLRTVATKDRACADFPYKGKDGNYDPAVILDLDYTVLLPR
ncbi:MAG: MaoC family dehydratase [Alphaproteobacteria bacterium]|nr:MaoC family dehydratase [Alphaproteobacteria bacterium]